MKKRIISTKLGGGGGQKEGFLNVNVKLGNCGVFLMYQSFKIIEYTKTQVQKC